MGINFFFGRNRNEKCKINPIHCRPPNHLLKALFYEVVRGQSRLNIGSRQFFDLCFFVFCLTKKNEKGMEKRINSFFFFKEWEWELILFFFFK